VLLHVRSYNRHVRSFLHAKLLQTLLLNARSHISTPLSTHHHPARQLHTAAMPTQVLGTPLSTANTACNTLRAVYMYSRGSHT
jgi:hypothetical protein